MTISNNRGDTPLHNAARWNHPALVNELLLYGARYSASNNDGRVPGELTTDEGVKELIWKAGRGIIAVGSYSPLNRRTPLGGVETGGSPPGSGGLGGEKFTGNSGAKKTGNLGALNRRPPLGGVETAVGSLGSLGGEKFAGNDNAKKTGNLGPLNRRTPGGLETSAASPPGIGNLGGEKSTRNDSTKTAENSHFTTLNRQAYASEETSHDLSHDRTSKSPDSVGGIDPESHDYVVIEDPLEQNGPQQGAEVTTVGQSSEEERAGREQTPPHQREEEEEPVWRPHPNGEEPGDKPHPNEEEPGDKPHPNGEGPGDKPHTKGNEKLRSLLVSIENFDRYMLYRDRTMNVDLSMSHSVLCKEVPLVSLFIT